MSNYLQDSSLGKKVNYKSEYSPSLLFAVPRSKQRFAIGISNNDLPFYGYDFWRAYEVSWLDGNSIPKVAIAEVTIPCNSKFLVESKSFKLYLNSFNNSKFADKTIVEKLIAEDLTNLLKEEIKVKLFYLGEQKAKLITQLPGDSLDLLNLDLVEFTSKTELIQFDYDFKDKKITECVTSDLLKSNCLVTGQPDWGSVAINYSGRKIDHKSLLQYIISYRNHNEFHEHCVERIFTDIYARCKPDYLKVTACYTRRGGLEINPVRVSIKEEIQFPPRLIRQ